MLASSATVLNQLLWQLRKTSCLHADQVSFAAQGTADAGPKALGIRNTNAPAGKPPAAATKASVAKRGAAGPGGKVKGNTSSGSIMSGPADDDDAGLAAGTLSKAEAEEKMLGLFGEGMVELSLTFNITATLLHAFVHHRLQPSLLVQPQSFDSQVCSTFPPPLPSHQLTLG